MSNEKIFNHRRTSNSAFSECFVVDTVNIFFFQIIIASAANITPDVDTYGTRRPKKVSSVYKLINGHIDLRFVVVILRLHKMTLSRCQKTFLTIQRMRIKRTSYIQYYEISGRGN